MHDSALNIETILIAGVVGLIALNALSYYSSKQKLLPGIIWTVIIGLVYSFISHFGLLPLPELELKSEIVLFLFVPLLIFASTISSMVGASASSAWCMDSLTLSTMCSNATTSFSLS